MRKKKNITLLRSGNMLVIAPTTPIIRGLLSHELTFSHKVFYQGKEYYQRKKNKMPLWYEQEWECFDDDHKGRFSTSYGFLERIVTILESAGYPWSLQWGTKEDEQKAVERDATVYKPRWDRIKEFRKSTDFAYRYRQLECLKLFAHHESGRIECPPAWGKGTMIMLGCMMYPKAKILVTTDRVPVLEQRLYPELSLNLPSVGIICGGRRKKGRRVMCINSDSLHHADDDVDFVFVDEGHEACADGFAERLARFHHARIWMFSATWNKRFDNKDIRSEAMAGPIRMTISMQEAVAAGVILDTHVHWSDVIMDINPCEGLDSTDKERAGIWSNEYRNKIIARDARQYDDQTQVLVPVKTIEHALYLKQVLPEFEMVYAGESLKPSDINYFIKAGLVPKGWQPMEDAKRQRITRQFSKAHLRKVIATSVWNVGVNFKKLQVICRADAGSSRISNTQIPGRSIRIDGDWKKYAVLHDYLDQFDTGYKGKALGRGKDYEENGWPQFHPDKKKRSRLRELLELGND